MKLLNPCDKKRYRQQATTLKAGYGADTLKFGAIIFNKNLIVNSFQKLSFVVNRNG